MRNLAKFANWPTEVKREGGQHEPFRYRCPGGYAIRGKEADETGLCIGEKFTLDENMRRRRKDEQ